MILWNYRIPFHKIYHLLVDYFNIGCQMFSVVRSDIIATKMRFTIYYHYWALIAYIYVLYLCLYMYVCETCMWMHISLPFHACVQARDICCVSSNIFHLSFWDRIFHSVLEFAYLARLAGQWDLTLLPPDVPGLHQ